MDPLEQVLKDIDNKTQGTNMANLYIKDIFPKFRELKMKFHLSDISSYENYTLKNIYDDLKLLKVCIDESPQNKNYQFKKNFLLALAKQVLAIDFNNNANKMPSSPVINKIRVKSGNPTQSKYYNTKAPKKIPLKEPSLEKAKSSVENLVKQETPLDINTTMPSYTNNQYHSLMKSHKNNDSFTQNKSNIQEEKSIPSIEEIPEEKSSGSGSTKETSGNERLISIEAQKAHLNLNTKNKEKMQQFLDTHGLKWDHWTNYCNSKKLTSTFSGFGLNLSELKRSETKLDESIEVMKFEKEYERYIVRRDRPFQSLDLRTMKVFITDPKLESEKNRRLKLETHKIIPDNLSNIDMNEPLSGRSSSTGWLPSINNLGGPVSVNKLDETNPTLLRGNTLELQETTPKAGNLSFASSSQNQLPSIHSRPSSRQKIEINTSKDLLRVHTEENNSPAPSPDFPGNVKKPPTPSIFTSPNKIGLKNNNNSNIFSYSASPGKSLKGKGREPIKAFESFSVQKVGTVTSKGSKKVSSISSNNKNHDSTLNNSHTKNTFRMSDMYTVDSEYIPSSKGESGLEDNTVVTKSAQDSQENSSSSQLKHSSSKEEEATVESVQRSSIYRSDSYISDNSSQHGSTISRSNSMFKSIAELEYRGVVKKKCMIGAGSQARVYLCEIPEFEDLFALKQFDLIRDKKNAVTYESLKNEFQMLRNLEHENVIPYYSIFIPRKNTVSNCIEFGFIMEYMSGGSLESYIEENFENISWKQKLSFLKQILKGLNYLHEHKIIHRDLKPGNILLSNDRTQLKITDFGISVKTNNDSTAKRSLVGTPWYMSPEVINAEAYSSKADIWAIGCCFFHLLTGRKPYHNSNAIQALMLMVTHKSPLDVCDPETLKKIEENEGARDFLELCFAREKSERPPAFKLLEHSIFDGIEC